ncbi:MAG: hypothetical protein COC01_06435 [Bacteroidetes bacterium]|nr:MAG: hypothetical protein COC01_06435 [Bacteroidota bacterium]
MEATTKTCTVCGATINVVIKKDNSYEGGNYFGTAEEPIKGTGKWVNKGKATIGGITADVTDWTGEVNEIEYWECDECYSEKE